MATDPFERLFGARRGVDACWGHGPPAREDAAELHLDLSFSVRWDEHDRRWTATATLADGTILHAEPSPHSAPAAAAELWQQMARKIRERLPEKPNRYGG
jgi:hypothetical protein